MCWTPDIQPRRAGKKGNLPPCPDTENSSSAMLWPSTKTMRTSRWTQHQQSSVSTVPRCIHESTSMAPANAPALKPCTIKPKQRMIPNGSASSKKKKHNCAKNVTSCAKPPNILTKAGPLASDPNSRRVHLPRSRPVLWSILDYSLWKR